MEEQLEEQLDQWVDLAAEEVMDLQQEDNQQQAKALQAEEELDPHLEVAAVEEQEVLEGLQVQQLEVLEELVAFHIQLGLQQLLHK